MRHLSCLFLLLRRAEDGNTSCNVTGQLAQVRKASSKQALNVTLYSVTDLDESLTTTWSPSLSASIPWMPEFDRF